MKPLDAFKHVRIGTVVQFQDGRLCTVENFDIRERVSAMPIRLKTLFGDPPTVIDAYFNEVIAVLTPVEHETTGIARLRERATACQYVTELKDDFAKNMGREPKILVVSNVAVREMLKWATEGQNGDGSWGPCKLFDLDVIISIYVSHEAGCIVVG